MSFRWTSRSVGTVGLGVGEGFRVTKEGKKVAVVEVQQRKGVKRCVGYVPYTNVPKSMYSTQPSHVYGYEFMILRINQ